MPLRPVPVAATRFAAVLIALAIGGGCGPLSTTVQAQGTPTAGMVSAKENEVSSLRAQAEALEKALAGDVCADPEAAASLLVPPSGTPSLGSAALGSTTLGATTDSAPAPSVASTEPAPTPAATGPDASPLRRQDLVARLHEAVVLVIADDGTGSGFFILPDVVMTNHHVVEKPMNGKVLVVGRGLAKPLEATIIGQTRGSAEDDQQDYALLKVPGANIAHPLSLTRQIGELTKVVAAGYPGLLLQTDNNFSSLIRGDMNAMPEMVLTQGVVMALQNRSRGLPNIAHTAAISGGNSGGPLIDACGRVVGINTFITVDVEQASSAGFALPTSDMLGFIQHFGVAPTMDERACAD